MINSARREKVVNDADTQLATTATFLSGVTATALQYLQQPTSSPLYIIVITLWFLSLVCSLGSALGYLFSVVWRAKFIHPFSELASPHLMDIMIKRTPTILLGLASVLLLAGLPLYLFDLFGNHHLFVPVLIAVVVLFVLSPLIAGGLFWVMAAYLRARSRRMSLAWMRDLRVREFPIDLV